MNDEFVATDEGVIGPPPELNIEIAKKTKSQWTVEVTADGTTLNNTVNIHNDRSRRKAAKEFVQMFAEREIEDIDEDSLRKYFEDYATKPDDEFVPEPHSPGKLMDSLGFQVLCEDDKGGVWIYSNAKRKSDYVQDIERLTYSRLIQIIGEKKARFVNADHQPDPMALFTLKEVKNAIAALAHKAPRHDSLRAVGQGIHQINNSTIIVNGLRTYKYRRNCGNRTVAR